MAGNKNSGRKCYPVELAKTEAIIKAWNKIVEEMDDKDVEKLALPIALKTMVDRHDVTSADKPIPILYVSRNNSDQADNANAEKNQGGTGRDISQQDGVNNDLLDSLSPGR